MAFYTRADYVQTVGSLDPKRSGMDDVLIILRVIVTLAVLGALWAFLRFKARMFNPAALREFTEKRLYLLLLSEETRDRVLERWGKVLLFAVVGFAVFFASGPPSNWILERFVPPRPTFLYLPDTANEWFSSLPPEAAFLGREREIAELHEFLVDRRKLTWWWLEGEPGEGEKVFILEWLRSLQKAASPTAGWDVGIYRAVGDDGLAKLTPRRPTLIVVMNAGEHEQAVVAGLRHLVDVAAELALPVRLLLVDRVQPMLVERLEEEGAFTAKRFKQESLRLHPLQVDHLATLAGMLDNALGKPLRLSSEQLQCVADVAEGSLLLSVLALQNALNLKHSPCEMNEEELISVETNRLMAKLKHAGVERECFALLALATMTGGLTWDEATRFQPDARCQRKDVFDRVYLEDTARELPPLKPDLIGQRFVLSVLEKLNDPQRRELASSAWVIGPSSTARNLEALHNRYGDPEAMDSFRQRPRDEIAALFWGAVQVNTYCQRARSAEDVEQHWGALRAFARDYATNASVQWLLLRGTIGAISRFGELRRFPEFELAVRTLMDVSSKLPRTAEVESKTAKGLVNGIGLAASSGFDALAQEYLGLLDEVAARHKKDREVQVWLARGIFSRISSKSRDGWTEDTRRWEAKLGELGARFPDVGEIQAEMAKLLVNQMIEDGLARRWGRVKTGKEQLDAIARRHPRSTEIQHLLCVANVNVIGMYGDSERWGELGQIVVEVEGIARNSAAPLALKQCLALALYNAVTTYMKGKRMEEQRATLEVLRRVGADYPGDLVISDLLVKAEASAGLGDDDEGVRR